MSNLIFVENSETINISLIAPDTAVSDFFFVFCPGGKRQKRRPKDGTGVRSGSDRA